MSGEGAHSDHISILRKDGRSFLTPGHRDKPDAAPQNYSGLGSADGRQPSASWTLQTPALRSRGWGCPHLLLALRSVGAVSCPGQMGFPLRQRCPPVCSVMGRCHRATTHRTSASRVFARFTDLFGYRRPPHCCWSHADARLSLYTVGP